MTVFEIPTLLPYFSLNQKQQDNRLHFYRLRWRQGQLLVSPKQKPLQPYLHSLENEQWLVECLKHSPVRLVRIDPTVGETNLKFWVSACKQASKAVFLRLPTAHVLPSRHCPQSWWLLKRLIDWGAASILLLVLSPVILGLVCLMGIYSPGPIFVQQWCVGERGKLFQLLKFRTTTVKVETFEQEMMGNQNPLQCEDESCVTSLGRWLRKSSLDTIPQLLNVLRGEMSIVGPRPWNLADAVRLSPEERQHLNALPGIIGALQLETRSNLLDLDALNRCSQEYLSNWSLWQDLKIVLLTVPKLFSGFNTY
ncbi:MAG: sugar transferase [Chroococcidiopsidaceae cyanobacterium CP_BM_RX_35]|nr:sugar transferase [Chroococcidiopsidaceae cyanobacterium CP_BM_RX_35]